MPDDRFSPLWPIGLHYARVRVALVGLRRKEGRFAGVAAARTAPVWRKSWKRRSGRPDFSRAG